MNSRGLPIREIALAGTMLVGFTTAAPAAPLLITLVGESGDDVAATVLFSYVGLNESSGRLEITLTNTSGKHDNRLTGLAFNLPDAVRAMDGFTSSASRWQADFGRDEIDAPGRLGYFDAAALTGPTFAGGSPRKGLAGGATADFSFALLGTGMLGLDEQSFLDLGGEQWPAGASGTLAARFQQVGREGDQGDVATPSGPPSATVSEPATLLLTGLGFLGLATLNRRRRTDAESAGRR